MECYCGVEVINSRGIIYFDFPQLKISFKQRIARESEKEVLGYLSILSALEFASLNQSLFKEEEIITMVVADPIVVSHFFEVGVGFERRLTGLRKLALNFRRKGVAFEVVCSPE